MLMLDNQSILAEKVRGHLEGGRGRFAAGYGDGRGAGDVGRSLASLGRESAECETPGRE